MVDAFLLFCESRPDSQEHRCTEAKSLPRKFQTVRSEASDYLRKISLLEAEAQLLSADIQTLSI